MSLKSIFISIVICLMAVSLGHTQEVPAANSSTQEELDEEGKKELSEEEQKKAQDLKKEALEKAEQQRKQREASKAKRPKEVFKPTEEISEDSPVPFPVDI